MTEQRMKILTVFLVLLVIMGIWSCNFVVYLLKRRKVATPITNTNQSTTDNLNSSSCSLTPLNHLPGDGEDERREQ